MGNVQYAHTAKDFEHIEEHSVGSLFDNWTTSYNYEAAGGQKVSTQYRKSMKLCKIYVDHGRMFGYRPDRSKVWLSDEQGKPYADASVRTREVDGYGTGPSILIAGTVIPYNPRYFMRTSSEKSDDFAWAQVNSLNDVDNAMSLNKNKSGLTDWHAAHMGQATRNLFFEKRPGDMWSDAYAMNKAIDAVGTKVLVPILEAIIDETVPFASTVIQISGAEAIAQKGLDDVFKKMYSSTTTSLYNAGRTQTLDPNFIDTIHDERLNEHLDNVTKLMDKYDPKKTMSIPKDFYYSYVGLTSRRKAEMLAQVTPAITDIAASKQRDQLNELLKPARKILGSTYDFSSFRNGWAKASSGQERLSLLRHYKEEYKRSVLPSLQVKLAKGYHNLSDKLAMFKLEKKDLDKEIKKTKKITDVVFGDRAKHQNDAPEGVSTVFG